MKKQTLFLMAGGLLAFASCNTETGGYTEAYVDSVVNERVAQIQMELEEQNEARIHALALEKADSILAARAGKTTTKRTTTPAKTTAPKESTPPAKDPTSVTNRKSTQENQEKASVTDRKSSQENQQKSSVTDRKSKSN
jgi:hypothetical protein